MHVLTFSLHFSGKPIIQPSCTDTAFEVTVSTPNTSLLQQTYPAVKRKHIENVPEKMTEQEFWTKFFQSHYYHRDRIHGHGVKDIFTECAKDDDRTIKEQLKAGVQERVANLGGFSDKTLDENYGTAEENPISTGSGSKKSSSGANMVHQSIIKRFNQHSIMVMRATDPSKSASVNGDKSATSSNNTNTNNEGLKRLREKLNYEDLESPPAKKTATLNLAKVERYLNGPTPANPSDYLSFDDISKARQHLRAELASWGDHRSTDLLSSSNAVSALVDLSPGGALMQARAQEALADQCPEKVQKELATLYASFSELSRHFWACFPPTNAALQEKALKMYETLKRFQQVKLAPFENELKRNYTSMSAQLTSHLSQMLLSVFRKYETWKQKKIPVSKR